MRVRPCALFNSKIAHQRYRSASGFEPGKTRPYRTFFTDLMGLEVVEVREANFLWIDHNCTC
jgi:hypothetical protein